MENNMDTEISPAQQMK